MGCAPLHRNLAFWIAVEDYKCLPREERKKRADEIYGKYFRPNSDYEGPFLPGLQLHADDGGMLLFIDPAC